MDILADIALQHFGTTNNILVYHNVPLGVDGQVAVVMVKHPPLRFEVEDCVMVEFSPVDGSIAVVHTGVEADTLRSLGLNIPPLGTGVDVWQPTATGRRRRRAE
ncbi:MAG: hypothetical protein U0768_13385 [Anaerolineae bacterium]